MRYLLLLEAFAACTALSGASAFLQSPGSVRRQSSYSNSTVAQERAEAVRDAYVHAWNGYYEYCFPQDQLQSVTNTCNDDLNGWGASAVDGFDTALIMQLPEIANIILAYIPTINFNNATNEVSLFETTIRYVGGMLAGYDLLSGPLSNLTYANNTENVPKLLSQAKALADTLKFAFDTPTGIPANGLYVGNQSTDGGETNGLATIGSLVLEWTHLSDLTGDDQYANLTQKGESYLINPLNPALAEPFPGLFGTDVNITTGDFVDNSGGWSGGDDSFYEYLIKMYVYDSDRFAVYRDAWIKAADSTIANLTSHPSSRPDLTFVAEFEGTMLINESEHLTCFDGGNFLLGGAVLGRQDYIDYGLELVDGCHDTYNSTATGIGPEIFSWNTTTLPANQTEFYDQAGFWIEDAVYILRPEVLESYYYAYRITGDQKYRDWSWEGFLAINATTFTPSGYSEIDNVNTPGGGDKLDNQDSFFLAEVLKYAYLIQAPDAIYQVENGGTNNFVFNTEAHVLKVAGTPV